MAQAPCHHQTLEPFSFRSSGLTRPYAAPPRGSRTPPWPCRPVPELPAPSLSWYPKAGLWLSLGQHHQPLAFLQPWHQSRETRHLPRVMWREYFPGWEWPQEETIQIPTPCPGHQQGRRPLEGPRGTDRKSWPTTRETCIWRGGKYNRWGRMAIKGAGRIEALLPSQGPPWVPWNIEHKHHILLRIVGGKGGVMSGPRLAEGGPQEVHNCKCIRLSNGYNCQISEFFQRHTLTVTICWIDVWMWRNECRQFLQAHALWVKENFSMKWRSMTPKWRIRLIMDVYLDTVKLILSFSHLKSQAALSLTSALTSALGFTSSVLLSKIYKIIKQSCHNYQ